MNCRVKILETHSLEKASECTFNALSDEQKFVFFSPTLIRTYLCQNLFFDIAEEAIFNL